VQHTFMGTKICPIGLDVLNLQYPRDIRLINKRIDEGYEMIQQMKSIDGLYIGI